MRFVKQFQVHRSPEEVYAYLLDVEHEARWNPWAIEVHKTTPGHVGEGPSSSADIDASARRGSGSPIVNRDVDSPIGPTPWTVA